MAREMKYSGTQWLKDIPSKWKVGKIQGLYFLRNTKVSDKDYEPLSVTKDGILPQLDSAAKTNAHDDRKLVKKGDFAINSRSDRRGSCGISDRDGSVSLINTILAPTVNMDPGYYNWLFHTTEFADEFYKWGHGIVDDLWTTNWQDMKKILIPSPSIQEQQLIASFLDSKCSNIDSLVADITKEIELLKEYRKSVIYEAVTKGLDPNVGMKDSGVEWIGKCPSTWISILFKYLHSGTNVGESIDKIYWEHTDDSRVFYTAGVAPVETSYLKFPNWKYTKHDDLLLARNGTPYVYLPCIGAVYSDHIIRVSIKHGVDRRFVRYGLQCSIESEMVDTVSIATWSASIWNKLKIALPIFEEQQHIADFLDSKCSQIDTVISDKQQQIEKLNEYKKSLIYEYVTGKKEVPAV